MSLTASRTALRRRVPRDLGIDRSAWRAGVQAGALAATVWLVLLATGSVLWTRSDVPMFEGVARSPFGDGRHLSLQPLVFGVAYRFGRILYPLAAWALALGRPQLVRPALAVLFLAGIVASGAAAGEIARRAGRPPVWGLVIFAAPFTLVWFGSGVLVSEPVVIALMLFAFLADADGRSRRARGLTAIALLAREMAIVPLLALPLAAVRRQGVRATVRDWWWVPIPYATWAVYVRVRIGDFPFTDPAASRAKATSLPFAGIVNSWTTAARDGRVSVLFGVATIALAVVLLARGGLRNPLAVGAALSTASIVCFGPYVWDWLGECLRVMMPTHVLLALVAVSRPRATPASAR